MTSSILWMKTIFLILQFSFGLGIIRNIQFSDDNPHLKGPNKFPLFPVNWKPVGTGIKEILNLEYKRTEILHKRKARHDDIWKHNWRPIFRDDFNVYPGVKINFDEYKFDNFNDRHNYKDSGIFTGKWVGMVIGCIFALSAISVCFKYCNCREPPTTQGTEVSTSSIERATVVQPAQPVVIQHYPPTPPPSYDAVQQHFSPLYHRAQEMQRPPSPGFKYSPGHQQFEQSPVVVQSSPYLEFQNQLPSPSSPYGGPPIVRY